MYKTHSLEEYQEVMRLRENGLNINKIFSYLSKKGFNISYGAISDWVYTDKKPFQEKILNKILPQNKFLSLEKAYILGVLCGDGYIRMDKLGNGSLIGLDVTDEDFADKFRGYLNKVYGLLPSKKKRIENHTNFSNNPKPLYVINLSSKLAANDLLKYSKSFKTKEWEVPKEILENPDLKIKAAFIRGIFDSEGTASLKVSGGVYLSVCSGNKNPLLKIKEILKNDFSIDLIVVYDKTVTRLKSAGYKNIKNFYNNINFSIKRKREKLRIGLSTYKRKGLRHYDKEFKLNVFSLLDQGFSACEIGKLLNFNRTNVYDFIKQRRKIENANI
ncbi:MAG: hypothetical protein KKD48_05230 [Nanoarchaeota archaeon]|nr:hypothetical protein [Nanoarchaeota archaeon]